MVLLLAPAAGPAARLVPDPGAVQVALVHGNRGPTAALRLGARDLATVAGGAAPALGVALPHAGAGDRRRHPALQGAARADAASDRAAARPSRYPRAERALLRGR